MDPGPVAAGSPPQQGLVPSWVELGHLLLPPAPSEPVKTVRWQKRLTLAWATCYVLYSRGAITLIAHTFGWRESKLHLEEEVKEEIDLASYNP